MIVLMTKSNFGSKDVYEVLVKIRLSSDEDYENIFTKVFDEFLRYHSLISVDNIEDGKMNELVYLVEFKKKINKIKFINRIKSINKNNKISIIEGEHIVDI